MTITIGSWVIPLVITLLAILWAAWVEINDDRGGGFFSIGSWFLTVPVVLVVSLASWLVWSLIR